MVDLTTVHRDGSPCTYKTPAECPMVYHFHPDDDRLKQVERNDTVIEGWDTANNQPHRDVNDNVAELIDGRVDVYGDPVAVFTRHAQVWSGILGIEVQPWQVALCQMGYKMVRTAVTPDYSDNSDDIDGYKDIFTKLIGEDMVHARDTKTYLERGGKGARA